MKRDEALRPLSREHLAALTVAKQLREVEDRGEAARSFLEFWNEDGKRHFRIEEEVLLPGWAREADVDHAGVSRMLGDHLAIRREALRVEADELSLDEIRELGDRLHDHVRFEERVLFPAAEAAMDDASLRRLGAAIERAESEGSSGSD